MKRYTALLAVPLLALSLASCGDANDATETPPAASETTPEASDDTTEDDASASETEAEAETSEADETTEDGTAEDSEEGESDAESKGSRTNPYAVGDTISLGDWDLAVNSVTLDGTDEVIAENQFNEPPAEGRQFVLVNLDATYTGDETGTFWLDISSKVLGSEGNTFGTGEEDYCGSIPEDLIDASEQFPGSTESGNICVSVPADQLEGALLMLEESLSFDDSRVFVALD